MHHHKHSSPSERPPLSPRRRATPGRTSALILAVAVVVAAALGGTESVFGAEGIPVLGNGKHTLDSVGFETLGTSKDGLNKPRDLAFNPNGDMELWVVNQLPPYQTSGDYPYVRTPGGAECVGPDDKPRTDPKHWSSTTTYYKLGTDLQGVKHVIDPWSTHFLAEASSIAFGSTHIPNWDGPSEPGGPDDPRSFATCGESRNEFKGCRAQQDFMGPALWSAAPEFYGESNDTAIDYLAKEICKDEPEEKKQECIAETKKWLDLGSHLDMLHESPNCMGVAWERANVYWVFDGCGGMKWNPAKLKPVPGGDAGRGNDPSFTSSDEPLDAIDDCSAAGDIVRYDFGRDHGPGYDNHCDGGIERYAKGVVKHVPGVPSHMQFDQNLGRLYIADTGNNRILVLDPEKAGKGREPLRPLREDEKDGCTTHDLVVPQARLMTLVDGGKLGLCGGSACMARPSGLVLLDDVFFVTDNALGRVLGFARDDGTLRDWLDLEVSAGALMGIEADAEGRLYLVDAEANKLYRIAPK